MSKQFLIVTLAMNGYQWAYRNFINTHKVYANKVAARHIEVSRPLFSLLGVECCWLKLYLLRLALQSGYQDVLILDADTWISEAAPDIRTMAHDNKYIYMARGYTNRFNSGVLWVRNHSHSIEFISDVIEHRLELIPAEDDVGWGENGHIIHHAKNSNIVFELPTCWNNTYDVNLVDYIRHFNHGPLRTHWHTKLRHKILARISRCWTKIIHLFYFNSKDQLPASWFNYELKRVLKAYPKIRQP